MVRFEDAVAVAARRGVIAINGDSIEWTREGKLYAIRSMLAYANAFAHAPCAAAHDIIIEAALKGDVELTARNIAIVLLLTFYEFDRARRAGLAVLNEAVLGTIAMGMLVRDIEETPEEEKEKFNRLVDYDIRRLAEVIIFAVRRSRELEDCRGAPNGIDNTMMVW